MLRSSESPAPFWRLASGEGHLDCIDIDSPLAQARIYLLGAHVSHFQPVGQKPLLFMSRKSAFAVGEPIRGGVPVIFPWFGGKADNPAAPAHGFVRRMPWKLENVAQQSDGEVTVSMALASDEHTRQLWPHDFELHFRVSVSQSLSMELEVRNTGKESFRFEEALHTYLAISDIRNTKVHGLAEVNYLDTVGGGEKPCVQQEPLIGFTGETDRLYQDTSDTCTADDAANGRRIVIEKCNSDSTVVWNPWIAKSQRMPDFGDDEWPQMLCIETCNVKNNAVTLGAGASHTMQAVVRIEPLS